MVGYCVRIAEVVSRDLVFREEALSFFRFLEGRPEAEVIVDFEGGEKHKQVIRPRVYC